MSITILLTVLWMLNIFFHRHKKASYRNRVINLMIENSELNSKMQGLIDVPIENYRLGYRPMDSLGIDRFVDNYIYFEEKHSKEIEHASRMYINWTISFFVTAGIPILIVFFYLSSLFKKYA